MAEAFLMNIMGRGNDGARDRVLNAPTNEAWIDPWVAHLRTLGVEFRLGQTVECLSVGGGPISSARARYRLGRTSTVEADWFVCAMPVERARRLWSRDVLALDSSLGAVQDLYTDWMNGIQFYIRDHITFIDGCPASALRRAGCGSTRHCGTVAWSGMNAAGSTTSPRTGHWRSSSSPPPGHQADGAGQPGFLRRAVRFLLAAGVRQFLDLGSGIPSVGNVHEIAQQADARARVLYVDIDPVAVAHSKAILAGTDLWGFKPRRWSDLASTRRVRIP